MMRKFLSILMLAGILITIGCSKKEEQPSIKKFTVTFNVQGGSAVEAQTVEEGKTITKPTQPTKDNCIFAGWFKEVACNNEWDFEKDVVTDNITLYAKWTYNASTYTVTFDAQGGTEVEAQTVEEGKTVTEPTQPTKEDFVFAGWFKEVACSNEWDFEKDVVTDNITLYAKWAYKTFTVTFNTNGGSAIEPKKVAEGGRLLKPTPPIKDTSAFVGWYKEAELTNEFDFASPITEDITIYAKWTTISLETLKKLIEEAESMNIDKYTRQSLKNVKKESMHAQEVYNNDSSTAKEIADAYKALSEAIAALEERTYISTKAIEFIGNIVDGYLYVTPEVYIDLRAEGCDKLGRASTNNGVIFNYESIKQWIDGDVKMDNNRFVCLLKEDIQIGSTAKIIIKSAEFPLITKEVNLKVESKDNIKKMFLDALASLPTVDKITYEHYDMVSRAGNLYHSLPYDVQTEQKISDAYEKLIEYQEVLPARRFYSFNGNICIFKDPEDGSTEETEFIASGTFPQGSYIFILDGKKWFEEEDDEGKLIWVQSRFNLKADNAFASDTRIADNPEGNNPSEWITVGEGTYEFVGNEEKGVLYLKEGSSISSPISASKCTSKNNKTRRFRAFTSR